VKIFIDNNLSKYKLYDDLKSIIDEYGVDSILSELPKIEDYHYSYFEKLWDYLGIDLNPNVKSYAMAEIWAWKGTKRIFDLFEKWFNVTIQNRVDLANFNARRLEIEIDITYRGNSPQLLKSLITDYFNFLLFFTEFKLIYRNLRHIIDVYYKRESYVNLVSFINVEGQLIP